MTNNYTEEHARIWFAQRQKARTDAFFLARHILGYKDVTEKIHGPIIAALQQFKGAARDEFVDNKLIYIPACSLWELEGPRDTIILHPRGTFKTTIATITHAIQWIINYPDVRILINTAIGDQQRKLAVAIASHFRFNEVFRFYFPEFCPAANKVGDWGSLDGFSVPNRQKAGMRENTVSFASIGKTIAGGHYEVIIYSDMVDKENIKTPGQIEEVKDYFFYTEPLIERSEIPPHHGWKIIEGTPYDFSDLHNTVLDREKEKEVPDWNIYVKSATNEDGTAYWPERLPLEELERIRKNVGDYIYSAQYECKCIPPSGGLAPHEQIKFVPRSVIREILPSLRKHVTIDLHGMEQADRHDYTVVTLAGFDKDGRMYVLDIKRGHYTPFQVIELIFSIHKVYPTIMDFKVEKDAHMRVLGPFLQREMAKRQVFPLIIAIPRSTTTSKVQRIRALQPWFQAGIIRFADDIDCRLELIQEITRFPKYNHDDILDTLADQMQNREGGAISDVMPDVDYSVPIPYRRPADRFLGFDPLSKEAQWSRDQWKVDSYYHETGL